jgi:uncharacterized protein (DUF58 family)
MAWAGLRFGPLLVVAGALLAAPELVFVGFLALLAAGLSGLWSRFGLRKLSYERTFGRERTVWGEDLPLDIAVRNDKLLPVAWLSVDDATSPTTVIREVPLVRTERRHAAILRSRWTVGWHERIVRHLTVAADRRGAYSFGPVRITVADLFGYGVATETVDDTATCIVRPRTLPVRIASRQHVPNGYLRSRESLFEDPALFAGVRPYRAGDPIRRVHWRATIRTGAPVSKRFDPLRAENILLALDVQTMSGAIWKSDEELVETLIVAASSLARQALLDGAACGLATTALGQTQSAFALIAPRTGRDQMGAIADLLGRLETAPRAPFEHLLVRLPQRVSPGTTIVVITGRTPEAYAEALIRLHRSAYPIELVALGPNARLAVTRARSLGLAAMIGSLTPDWRTSDALVLAS